MKNKQKEFSMRIGGRKYKVKIVPPEHKELKHMSNNYYYEGLIDYPTRTIYVNSDVKEKDFILLHEILHGLFSEMGAPKTVCSEKFVRVFTHMLWEAIRSAGLKVT